MNVNDCIIYNFPKISDYRGNLSFIEANVHIPFSIKRVFYVYDIPTGQDRGAHAHRTLEQLIFCVSGSVEIRLDDGINEKVVKLNRPWQGLYIPPMIWSSNGNFDPGTVYVVLASEYYDENEYLRNYDSFLKALRNGK